MHPVKPAYPEDERAPLELVAMATGGGHHSPQFGA
jgi:hypothetical protein